MSLCKDTLLDFLSLYDIFNQKIKQNLKMSWKKIVKESIGEQIYAILKEDILHAKRKPEEKLNPRKLAEEFKTGIMPVRDVLNQLVDEGLAVRKQNP